MYKYKIPRFRPSLSTRAIINILKRVFSVSQIGNDEKNNRQFEGAFAQYLGVRNAISVPSGRLGLYLILKNLGLDPKSQIILPAFTFWAVPEVITYLNFKPVFVDINLQTCNLDVLQIENKINKFTKVILPTHLYGLPCPMDSIVDMAKRHNLTVVEDCAQACGAEYKGRKIGSFGDAAYFSFDITKNLSLLGGGMAVTNDTRLAENIRKEVNSYGFFNRVQLTNKLFKSIAMKILTEPLIFDISLFAFIRFSSYFNSDTIGKIFEEKEKRFNSFPEDYFKMIPFNIQSETGLDQLKYLDELNYKRIENAAYLLTHIKKSRQLTLPFMPEAGIKNIFTSFPIQVNDRIVFAKKLLKRGIDTSLGYIRSYSKDCLNARQLEQNVLHIPVFPALNKNNLSHIANSVNEVLTEMNL